MQLAAQGGIIEVLDGANRRPLLPESHTRLLRVRGDLRCAGKKHSHGERKKCALREGSARKKLNYLIHFVRSKRALRRKTIRRVRMLSETNDFAGACSRTIWYRLRQRQQVAAQMRQGSNGLQATSEM